MAVGQINLDVEVEVLIANKLAHASFVGVWIGLPISSASTRPFPSP